MPPAVFSSAASRLTTTLAPKGTIFMSDPSFLNNPPRHSILARWFLATQDTHHAAGETNGSHFLSKSTNTLAFRKKFGKIGKTE